jgi:hypothetical protein
MKRQDENEKPALLLLFAMEGIYVSIVFPNVLPRIAIALAR